MSHSLVELVSELVMLEGTRNACIFADAVASGELRRVSTSAALQERLAVPQSRLRPYREILLTDSDAAQVVLALRAAAAGAARAIEVQPRVEVAWTYPGNTRPGIRTTGGVSREIIDGARSSLLVVGYVVTIDPNLTGLAFQTVDSLARAAERGVQVTAVLDRAANRSALLKAWRTGVRLPAVFTWPATDDKMASVHAKVLVGDRRDSLVTSANLTYHGLERNLEMGVRITGRAAAEMHDRIHELIAARELVPWATSQ